MPVFARRTLNERAARRDHATRLRILDDCERSTVLDGRTGISKLALAVDFRSRRSAWPLQQDERRVANQGERVGRCVHGSQIAMRWPAAMHANLAATI